MGMIKSNKNWHRIEINISSQEEFLKCLAWCREQFGSNKDKTYELYVYEGRGWFYQGSGVFRFLNDEDAILFKLKWN